MTDPRRDTATYPADSAFVVQFRSRGPEFHFCGRVEHVASGHRENFESTRDLLRILQSNGPPRSRHWPS